VLESGNVDDADMLFANDKDEGESCLIKLGHRECKRFIDISSIRVLNIPDSGPVDYQVHMRRKTSHKKLVLYKFKWIVWEFMLINDRFSCCVVDDEASAFLVDHQS
jgi:hypothetical protein